MFALEMLTRWRQSANVQIYAGTTQAAGNVISLAGNSSQIPACYTKPHCCTGEQNKFIMIYCLGKQNLFSRRDFSLNK